MKENEQQESNTTGGPIDLSNVADRIVKPTLKKAGLKWCG